jgi:hypothetical protein
MPYSIHKVFNENLNVLVSTTFTPACNTSYITRSNKELHNIITINSDTIITSRVCSWPLIMVSIDNQQVIYLIYC